MVQQCRNLLWLSRIPSTYRSIQKRQQRCKHGLISRSSSDGTILNRHYSSSLDGSNIRYCISAIIYSLGRAPYLLLAKVLTTQLEPINTTSYCPRCIRVGSTHGFLLSPP